MERAQHADLLDEHVARWIADRTRAEVMAAFEAAGAAVAPVYSPADLVHDPQVQDREMLIEVADPDLGSLLQHNVLFRMSETPGRIQFTGRAYCADTDDVLAELGYDPTRIQALRDAGVIR